MMNFLKVSREERQVSYIRRMIARSKLIFDRNNKRGKMENIQNAQKDQEILFEKT